MILYPFGCIPEAYIIDNVSMQIGLTISAICLIIGAGLKIFINTSIVFAYIGQFLTAIFQPAILNSPGKIAATWFNEKKRTLVTSICCVSNTIGVMFGYIFHVFFIEENTVNPKIWKDSFQFYLIMEFIITFFSCLLFMTLMRNKPKFPPSYSQQNYKILSLKEGLQSLKKDTNFIKLLISLTCIVGFINIFGTIFNSYMALYKIKDSSATYTAATANLVGIVAALFVGHIIDKSKKYKYAMIICNIISLCTFIVTLILMETINQKYLSIASFICYTLIIGFSVPIYTSGMDFVCEITYPVGESISEGVIMTFNQIMGIIGILICDSFRLYLKQYKFLTNLFCIILFIISCVTLLLVNPELKRNNRDKKKQIDKENENQKNDEEKKNLIVDKEN
jgi:sugar phosphate permease